MSNNLVKRYMTTPEEESARVIDSNERVRQRLAQIGIRLQQEDSDGFVPGLSAENVEILLQEDGDFGGQDTGSASAEMTLESARAEAEQMLADAQEEAEQILSAAHIRAENEKSQVIAQAREQGYQEGLNRAEEQTRRLERDYQQRVRELEEEFQRQIDILEPQFVDTITGIYEHIFHVELDSYREILTHLITNTIRKLEGVREFMVHVSREDYPYVNMQKKQIMSQLASGYNVDIVEDMTLERNQCMIETENGIYDCGLGTQLAELKRRLMLLAWSGEN